MEPRTAKATKISKPRWPRWMAPLRSSWLRTLLARSRSKIVWLVIILRKPAFGVSGTGGCTSASTDRPRARRLPQSRRKRLSAFSGSRAEG